MLTYKPAMCSTSRWHPPFSVHVWIYSTCAAWEGMLSPTPADVPLDFQIFASLQGSLPGDLYASTPFESNTVSPQSSCCRIALNFSERAQSAYRHSSGRLCGGGH